MRVDDDPEREPADVPDEGDAGVSQSPDLTDPDYQRDEREGIAEFGGG